MKMWQYIGFYIILAIICTSQVVVVLGQIGQRVHASEQLSYFQKRKLQLQQETNQHVINQAQLLAINSLTDAEDKMAGFQPIASTLTIESTNTNTISLNADVR